MKLNYNRIALWFLLSMEIIAFIIAGIEMAGVSLHKSLAPSDNVLVVYVEKKAYPILDQQIEAFLTTHSPTLSLRIRTLRKRTDISQLLTKRKLVLVYHSARNGEWSHHLEGELLFQISDRDYYWHTNVPNSSTAVQLKNFLFSDEGRDIAKMVLARKKKGDS